MFFYYLGGQLLVIVDARTEDSGMYTCVMTNTLGEERGTATLSVIPKGAGGHLGYDRRSGSTATTTTGIVVIAVVCCVVGTSLVWVVIIYQTRTKRTPQNTQPKPTQDSQSPDEYATIGSRNGVNQNFTSKFSIVTSRKI